MHTAANQKTTRKYTMCDSFGTVCKTVRGSSPRMFLWMSPADGLLLDQLQLVHKYCLMTSERCVKLVTDVRFQVTHFGTTAEICVSWEELAHYRQELTIVLPTINRDIVPGRYVFPTGEIPGKLYPHDNNLYVVKDDVLYYGSDQKEVLQIVPECHVTWVDYTAGDDLPEGAVVGGTWGGATLYVIKGEAAGGHVECGYYHSIYARGFVENYGVIVLTNMEMLVVLWSVEHLWWTDNIGTWKRFYGLLALLWEESNRQLWTPLTKGYQ